MWFVGKIGQAATVLSVTEIQCARHVHKDQLAKRAWGSPEPLAHCDKKVPGLDVLTS